MNDALDNLAYYLTQGGKFGEVDDSRDFIRAAVEQVLDERADGEANA